MAAKDLSQGVAWLAGESSGDFLASLVLPELARRLQGAEQYGIGGPKMQAAGLSAWYSADQLAVRGYSEVLKKLPGLLLLRHRMIDRVVRASPRVFIGVDAPDFNLGVETALRTAGVPTVHFVSPSVWAWRPERLVKIAQAVDHMLLIFPFEQEIYDRAGIPATYIGHPLAGIIPMEPDTQGARQQLGLDGIDGPIFAVLPGSRIDEVSGCAPVFFQACERVRERLGAGHFVLPAVDENRREQIEKLAAQYPGLAQHMSILCGCSHRVLEASDAVLVASGTATLEAALFKKPMVVGYVSSGISAMIIRKKGLIPYVSLPNILAGKVIVPEFLHYFCTPDAIAASLIEQLRPSRREFLSQYFHSMHESLLRPTADLACNAIESVMRPQK